jgi:hypothetical protein
MRHSASPGPTRKRRKRRGAPDTLYPREEITRVLKRCRDPSARPEQLTPTALAREEFSRVAVARVQRLDKAGAFRLGSRGGLRVYGNNGEFRAAGKTVSLRALERALGLEPLA